MMQRHNVTLGVAEFNSDLYMEWCLNGDIRKINSCALVKNSFKSKFEYDAMQQRQRTNIFQNSTIASASFGNNSVNKQSETSHSTVKNKKETKLANDEEIQRKFHEIFSTNRPFLSPTENLILSIVSSAPENKKIRLMSTALKKQKKETVVPFLTTNHKVTCETGMQSLESFEHQYQNLATQSSDLQSSNKVKSTFAEMSIEKLYSPNNNNNNDANDNDDDDDADHNNKHTNLAEKNSSKYSQPNKTSSKIDIFSESNDTFEKTNPASTSQQHQQQQQQKQEKKRKNNNDEDIDDAETEALRHEEVLESIVHDNIGNRDRRQCPPNYRPSNSRPITREEKKAEVLQTLADNNMRDPIFDVSTNGPIWVSDCVITLYL
jgi:hypothetical protein